MILPNRTTLAFVVWRGVHDAADRVDELRPPILFARELRLARLRQLVVLRALIGFAEVPRRLEPSAIFETVERRVQGAGLDLEEAVGLRPDGLADAVAVLGTPLQGPEDEHVEGALEQLQSLAVGVFGHGCRQSTALDVGRLRLVPAFAWLRRTAGSETT